MRALFFNAMAFMLVCCTKPESVVQDRMRSVSFLQKSDSVMQGSTEWENLLDSAILLDTMNAKAYMERSVWFTKTGDYVNAFRYLDKAVEKDPMEFLGYRGWLRLHKLHDYKGAIDDLERLDRLTPEIVDYPWSENIHYLIGIAYMGLGDHQKAIGYFTRCIEGVKADRDESWVDVYVFLDKGICYRQLNQHDSSIVNFDKMISYCDKCPEGYFQKAVTLKLRNQDKEACLLFLKSQQYIQAGYTRNDPYKDYLNQLYPEQVEEALKECR